MLLQEVGMDELLAWMLCSYILNIYLSWKLQFFVDHDLRATLDEAVVKKDELLEELYVP